jgi:hypothetical protein
MSRATLAAVHTTDCGGAAPVCRGPARRDIAPGNAALLLLAVVSLTACQTPESSGATAEAEPPPYEQWASGKRNEVRTHTLGGNELLHAPAIPLLEDAVLDTRLCSVSEPISDVSAGGMLYLYDAESRSVCVIHDDGAVAAIVPLTFTQGSVASIAAGSDSVAVLVTEGQGGAAGPVSVIYVVSAGEPGAYRRYSVPRDAVVPKRIRYRAGRWFIEGEKTMLPADAPSSTWVDSAVIVPVGPEGLQLEGAFVYPLLRRHLVGGSFRRSALFSAEPQHAIAPDGRVLTHGGATYSLAWWRLADRMLTEALDGDVDLQPTSDADMDSAFERQIAELRARAVTSTEARRRLGLQNEARKLGRAAHWPVLGQILVSPDGRVILERLDIGKADPRSKRSWDLLGTDHRIEGRFLTPSEERALAFIWPCVYLQRQHVLRRLCAQPPAERPGSGAAR